MRMLAVVAALAGTCFISAACGTGGDGGGPPAGDDPPLAEGYTRFRAEPVMIAPGESQLLVHWVAAPADRDLHVVDVIGHQTRAGHHAILYTTPEVEAIGTTREWTNVDQVSTRFIGGVGGPGGSQVAPPPGAAMRIPKGHALVIQSHWLNTSDEMLIGDSIVDALIVEPSSDRTVVSFFAVTDIAAAAMPGESSFATGCTLPHDIGLVRYANHMHEYGTTSFTTVTHADESVEMLKEDPVWNYEWALAPNWEQTALDAPHILPAGSRIEVNCAWRNPGAEPIYFPDEMCVFFGLYIGDEDVTCSAGSFNTI